MLFVYNITSSWTELLRQNQMWIQKVAIGRAPPPEFWAQTGAEAHPL